MKGVLLFFAASIVTLATGQDCPAYYVRSQSGQSCYRYFNMRVPFYMANEFCEMITPCGNGPAIMGALVSVDSAQENMEIHALVSSFSQDNQMDHDVWLGWNSQNARFWVDGTPAAPNGFHAFGGPGVGPQRRSPWPAIPRTPPGQAAVMERQRGQPPLGPRWTLTDVRQLRAFVCEVPIGQNLPPSQPGVEQPGVNQPGVGGPRMLQEADVYA